MQDEDRRKRLLASRVPFCPVGRKEPVGLALSQRANPVSDPGYFRSSKTLKIGPSSGKRKRSGPISPKIKEASDLRSKEKDATTALKLRDGSIFSFMSDGIKPNPAFKDRKFHKEDAVLFALAENVKGKLSDYYGKSALSHNLGVLEDALDASSSENPEIFDLNRLEFVSDGTGTREKWIRDSLDATKWKVGTFESEEGSEGIWVQDESNRFTPADRLQKERWFDEIREHAKHVGSSDLGPGLSEINDDYEALVFDYASSHVDYQFDSIYDAEVTVGNLTKRLDTLSRLDESSRKLDSGAKRLPTEAIKLLFSYDDSVLESIESEEYALKWRLDFDDSLFAPTNEDMENEFKRGLDSGFIRTEHIKDETERFIREETLRYEENEIFTQTQDILNLKDQFESNWERITLHLTMEMIWDDLCQKTLNDVDCTHPQKTFFSLSYDELNSAERVAFWVASLSIMIGFGEYDDDDDDDESSTRSNEDEFQSDVGPKYAEDKDIGTGKQPRFALTEEQVNGLQDGLMNSWYGFARLWEHRWVTTEPKPWEITPKSDIQLKKLQEELYAETKTRFPPWDVYNVEELVGSLVDTYTGTYRSKVFEVLGELKDMNSGGKDYLLPLSMLEYDQIRESVYRVCGFPDGSPLDAIFRDLGESDKIANKAEGENERWKTFVVEALGSGPNSNGLKWFDELNRRTEALRKRNVREGLEADQHLAQSGLIEDYENTRTSFWKPLAMTVKEDWDSNKSRYILTQELSIYELYDDHAKFKSRKGVARSDESLEYFVETLTRKKIETYDKTELGSMKLSEIVSRIHGFTKAMNGGDSKARDRLKLSGEVFVLANLQLNRKYVNEKWIEPMNEFFKIKVAEHNSKLKDPSKSLSDSISSVLST